MSANAKSAAVKAHRERNAAPRTLGAWNKNGTKRRAVDADMDVDPASYARLREDAGLSPRTNPGDDEEETNPPDEHHDEDDGGNPDTLLPEMEALILATNVKSPANMSPAWRRFLNELHATLHAAGLCQDNCWLGGCVCQVAVG